jgi:hypothetical protein
MNRPPRESGMDSPSDSSDAYSIEPERIVLGRVGHAPELGTFQPSPPYRVRKCHRSSVPCEPPTTSSKLP